MSLFRRFLSFILGSILFLGFILFSYLVHKDLFTQLDFDTTVRLQDNLPRRLDDFFSLFSFVGSFEIAGGFLFLLLVFYRKLGGIIVLLSFVGFHVVELFGKTFVHHLPPPQFLLRTHLPFEFPQFYVRAENSYPSGHSARALFISVIIGIILLRSKKLSPIHKIIIFSLVCMYDVIMLTSRVYLGEHWLSDVIGGFLLGTSTAFLGAVVL